jgi:hypothetical protein
MRKFTSLDEINQTVSLLKQKPEIDQKISYYTTVLRSTSHLIDSISDRINKGYTREVFKLLGIGVVKRCMLDAYDIAKLEIEKIEAEARLFAQQNYFEMWLSRSRDYEVKFDEITRECNLNYDLIVNEASQITENIRLQNTMAKFSNPDNDQRIKNEYYLYLKQEVENASQYGRRKSA